MRSAAVFLSAAALIGGSLALSVGPSPAGAATGARFLASSSSDWLGEVNAYRAASGLPPVTDNPSWDAGLLAHFNYLAKTPASYETGQYASAHTENPQSPYYTQAGAQEGGRSDLYPGGVGNWTPVQLIDGWLTAPFHAIGMLRRGLTQVAFAQGQGAAGLDVIGGLSYPQPTTPTNVLFPGNGMTTNLGQYAGGEYPDPLETCGWQNVSTPIGLPLIAMLSVAPSSSLTATLTSTDGQKFSTSAGNLCVVDESTYKSSDTVYGPTGLQILQGDQAVLLFPKAALDAGTYSADISQPGQPDITWSFNEDQQAMATSISPSSGGMSGGATVTVYGQGFVPGSTTVSFGAQQGTHVIVLSHNQLTVVAPALSAGSYAVSVANQYGSTTSPDGAPRYRAGLQQFSVVKASHATGTGRVGRRLVEHRAVLRPSATKVTYQWLRNGRSIPHATKASYLLTKADRHKRISVRVTYSRFGYLAKTQTILVAKHVK